MTPVRYLTLAALWLGTVAVAGCDGAERKPGDTVERPGQPPVTYVADDDPKMLAAIAKARSTADQFIAALKKPNPGQSDFSVKVEIKDGERSEHMWVLPVRYQDGKFTGRINNEPDQVRTVKIGDEVSVAKDKISDWMYVEKGKLIGGYTIRALRDRMPPEERKDFDRTVPFTVD